MSATSHELLKQEWQNLHQDQERYDRYGLLIKLTATLSTLIAITFVMALWIAILFILVLWLQEGIWRTVQSRSNERIMAVEKALKEVANGAPSTHGMQFYTEWEASRPGTAGLIKEYVVNAVRPTVAYPYVLLIAVVVALALF